MTTKTLTTKKSPILNNFTSQNFCYPNSVHVFLLLKNELCSTSNTYNDLSCYIHHHRRLESKQFYSCEAMNWSEVN